MRHFVIPDTQVKPDSNTEHLTWAGKYAVAMKPDVIIHLGDHWDFPSLSSYDKGKKSFEGRRYQADVASGKQAMEAFLAPIKEEQARLRTNKHKLWKPKLVFLLGNHENRITRAVEDSPELEGLMSFDDLGLEKMGWEVVPFLEVKMINGIAYSHYFTSGVMGRPVASARMLLTKKMVSCVMGHVQDRDIAYARRADGLSVTGLFAGIFYQEDQSYLSPQTNLSWRGIWVFNEVDNGSFDELPISMSYLRKKFGESTE